jgi:hypothetical protein
MENPMELKLLQRVEHREAALRLVDKAIGVHMELYRLIEDLCSELDGTFDDEKEERIFKDSKTKTLESLDDAFEQMNILRHFSQQLS